MKKMICVFLLGVYMSGCENETIRNESKMHPDSLLAPARLDMVRGDFDAAREKGRKWSLIGNRETQSAARIFITMLDSVESVRKKEWAEKVVLLKKRVRVKTDDMNGVTWYYSPKTTQHSNQNSFHLYIGESADKVWLRLRIQYCGDDWIFMDHYTVKADSTIYQIFSTSTTEKDNSAEKVWEIYDGPVMDADTSMLSHVSRAKSVKLRMSGKYYIDRVLSKSEQQSVGEILDLFKMMSRSR